MRSALKALFYAALLAACYWCGFSAYRDYTLLMMDDGGELSRGRRSKPTKGTNTPPASAAAETNVASLKPTPKPASGPAATAPASETVEEVNESPAVTTNRRVGRNYLRLLGYTVGFAAALTVLGFVAAQDFGYLLRFRMGREVSYVSAKSERKGQYERAEYLILKGDHHAAIRLLQGLVAKQPDNVHMTLRIAEVYDKELQDFPNAALHYERVLKLELPAEQWGWLAIRLSNIYSGKLSQPQAALALIRRIAAEHPETQAGGKALKRLARLNEAGLGAEAEGEA